MTSARCVIFDLDGILVDSEVYWRAGFRETVDVLAAEAGLTPPELPDDVLEQYEGGRVPDTIGALVRDHLPSLWPLDDERLLDAVDVAVGTAALRITEVPRTLADSVRAASELHAAGYTLAVASSSARAFIDAALDSVGLGDVIAIRESAFDVEHAKPHPEVYLKALATLGSDSHRCVAVEDSETGVRAALAAGLSTIWRTTTPRTLDGITPLSEDAPRNPDAKPWLIWVTEVSAASIESAF